LRPNKRRVVEKNSSPKKPPRWKEKGEKGYVKRGEGTQSKKKKNSPVAGNATKTGKKILT